MPTWASRLTRAEKAFSTSSVARNTASRYAASAGLLATRAGDLRIDAAEVEQAPASPRTPRAWFAPLVKRLPLEIVVALPSSAPSENLG